MTEYISIFELEKIESLVWRYRNTNLKFEIENKDLLLFQVCKFYKKLIYLNKQ